MNEFFRKILLDEMKKQNLSDYDLSKKSGLTARAICHYRNGKRNPTLESADKLLKVLGINLTIGSEEK